MKVEKTPEEAARSKRAHADSMILMGAVTTVAALVAAWIAMSGRGDVPDWMFGGGRASRAPVGEWTNSPSAVSFEDWGPAPFARARKEGKLVLLFLGPSFSAPTARMEAGTFGDRSAAGLAGGRFIPVRVRSEDSPDLDRRYRSGGWPTTAALLPDGVPLAAGTAMTPEVFRRWAGALADKAAAHPEVLARVDAEAAERRRAAASESAVVAVPMDAGEAERRAQAALLAQWDPARRTFDRVGPRFPRFERIAALRALKPAWARELARDAAKGSLVFQDPKDGGFWRAANPDGSPAALETLAADQAGALDVLCGAMPASARKELGFLDGHFAVDAMPAWRGWRAGYALSADGRRAADGGPLLERPRARPEGPARLGENAELSRAVLSCAQASPAQKAFARRALERAWSDFGRETRARDPRLLLDDAVGLGGGLLAAGRTEDALAVWRWMDANLSAGPAFLDRLATGVLPSDMDQIADPALNARVLAFMVRLRRPDLARRGKDLYAWLSARSDSLDPAVWAALAASVR
jgi:hypothetical protein